MRDRASLAPYEDVLSSGVKLGFGSLHIGNGVPRVAHGLVRRRVGGVCRLGGVLGLRRSRIGALHGGVHVGLRSRNRVADRGASGIHEGPHVGFRLGRRIRRLARRGVGRFRRSARGACRVPRIARGIVCRSRCRLRGLLRLGESRLSLGLGLRAGLLGLDTLGLLGHGILQLAKKRRELGGLLGV